MPWCAGCDRFLSPSTVTTTGECPRCGAPVDPGRARSPETAPPTGSEVPVAPVAGDADGAGEPTIGDAAIDRTREGDEDDPFPLPWHFKLLVGAIALYLGWRAVQGVEWVVRLF